MSNKKLCSGKCKKERPIADFYASSDLALFPDGKLHICKPCIKEMINLDDMDTIYKMLQMINKPFLPDAWQTASESPQDTFGVYVRIINGKQYKDRTWKDSVLSSSEIRSITTETKSPIEQPKKSNFVVTDDLIDFWGFGYSPDEYEAFERKYMRLKRSYSEKTEMHSEALKVYIRYRVKEEMATARGESKDAKEWGALAQKAATDAKLNPNQMSKSDVSGGADVMSQLVEMVESHIGIIPLMPRLIEQPYDDADMIIWSNINYSRKLEEKSRVSYREVYQFYDQMIEDYCRDANMSDTEIEEYKNRRKNIFRDMELAFQEPLYSEVDESVDEGLEDDE